MVCSWIDLSPQGWMRFANKEKLGLDPAGLGFEGYDSSICQSGPWHLPVEKTLDQFAWKALLPQSTETQAGKSDNRASTSYPGPSTQDSLWYGLMAKEETPSVFSRAMGKPRYLLLDHLSTSWCLSLQPTPIILPRGRQSLGHRTYQRKLKHCLLPSAPNMELRLL